MSDNDTTQPSPNEDIRSRLSSSSPLPWTEHDARTLVEALDETVAKYRRVCTAVTDQLFPNDQEPGR